MKNFFFTLLTLLAFAILGSSCQSEEFPEDLIQQFFQDEINQNIDSLETANLLIGHWKLKYVYCCPEGTDSFRKADKNEYLLQFRYDSVYAFSEGQPVGKASWQLKTTDTFYYGIDTEPFLGNTIGRIFFSKNMLLLNNSYIDGGDLYYVRTK